MPKQAVFHHEDQYGNVVNSINIGGVARSKRTRRNGSGRMVKKLFLQKVVGNELTRTEKIVRY